MSGQPRRVRDKPRLLPLTNAITFNTKYLIFSELVNNDSRDVLADFTDVILVSEDTYGILYLLLHPIHLLYLDPHSYESPDSSLLPAVFIKLYLGMEVIPK